MPNFECKDESIKPGSSPDSAIKLFGKRIPLRIDEIGGGSSTGSTDGDGDDHNDTVDKNNNNNHGGFEAKVCGESENDKASSGEEINDEPEEKFQEKMRMKASKPVACPRCQSMDTKFCYFNNYSVNQPRHYCRNCQRYWTAGGSLRNVPVGAGRRKNKPSLAIHHTHIVEGNPCVWNDEQECIPGNSEKLVKIEAYCPELGHFGQTLNAGSSSTEGKSKPRPENFSHSEALDLPRAVKNCFWSSGRDACSLPWPESSAILSKGFESFRKADSVDREKPRLSPEGGESAEDAHPVDDGLCGSSATVSNSEREKKADAMDWAKGFYSVSFIGSPWPSYYNGYWGNASPGIHEVRGMQRKGVPWCQPGTGFLPAVNGSFSSSLAWGMAWRPANVHSSPTALGKHQRDHMSLSQSKFDESLWAPKTLRINDAGEAARSSIQASLGLGNRAGPITSDGIFKAFRPKIEDIASAKPAALSRSAAFVESS